jgi:peroxiredoxin
MCIHRWRILGVALLGAFVLTTVLGCEQPKTEGPKTSTAIGDFAPAISVEKLDGTRASLEDYKGKAIMLNVWATWCGPCRNELPAIQAAYEQYRDKGVEFLGVNMQEDKNTVSRFVEQYKLTYPILLDQSGSVAKAYRVSGVPTTYFIDKEGIIRAKWVGEMNADVITKGITLAMTGGK